MYKFIKTFRITTQFIGNSFLLYINLKAINSCKFLSQQLSAPFDYAWLVHFDSAQ